MSHKSCDVYLANPETEQCPLCLRQRVLEQDHDHRTELCRGRVCHSCNILIGRFDRPIGEIQRFLDYLRTWSSIHAESGGRRYSEYLRDTAAAAQLPGSGGHSNQAEAR